MGNTKTDWQGSTSADIKSFSATICASVFDRRHLRKAAIAAAVRMPDGYRFGLHNLRHSLSNWLVNQGKVDPKTVQVMRRHAKVQTTLDLYAQGDNDDRISARDRFCGLIVDQPAGAINMETIQKNGGDDETRTRDLCRDRAAF